VPCTQAQTSHRPHTIHVRSGTNRDAAFINEATPVVLLGVIITQRHPDWGILPRHLVPGGRDKSVLVKKRHAPGGRLVAIVVVEGGRPSCSSLTIPVFHQFGLA
jgi:hypothetical protein